MKYPFNVFQTQVDDHVFWVAKSTTLKGCVGQGETAQEAVDELASNEIEWIVTAEEVGTSIPIVPIEPVQEYSGKLTLRVSPSVHKQAALIAKKEGVSLNQYLNDAIVSKNSEMCTVGYISQNLIGLKAQIEKRFFRIQTLSANKGEGSFSLKGKQIFNNVC